MSSPKDFQEWNQELENHFSKLLGDRYLNKQNLSFLMNDLSYREYAYKNNQDPEFYALEIWHDHGLNTDFGKETFLVTETMPGQHDT